MSTEYSLYKELNFGELTVDEMSNKLSLDFNLPPNIEDFDLNLDYFASKKMSPESMAKIFLSGLQICSYWMEGTDLESMIKKFLAENIY